jgi:DNA transformation protein and related proteins
MAKAPDSFTQHALDQLEPLGNVGARWMFGAWCLTLDGNMLAIVDGGKLYLKVNDETKPVFAQAGGEPFTYFHKSKNARVEMNYRSVPDGDLDDRAALLRWARLAADVARAKGAAKKKPAAAAKKAAPKKSGTKAKAEAKPKKAKAKPKAKAKKKR